jgi:hypothetical protein
MAKYVLFTLATLEGLAVGLLAFFWFVMRPDLLATYGLGGKMGGSGAPEALPLATRVALSGWFVPLIAAVGGALMLAALLIPWPTRTRTYVGGAGLVWTVFNLVLAIWAAYGPAFEHLAP